MAVKREKIHGGRVFEAAELLGCHWTEIVDFSANINPLGQPKGLKEAVFRDFARTLHYPEPNSETLVARLAALTGLGPDNIIVGAGSTPHLHLLARALGLSRPVIAGPAFAEYEAALGRAGLKARYVLARERDGWEILPETVERIFQAEPDAVFLANPANPTGRLVKRENLEALADGCSRRRSWLIVDEAFIDFTAGGFSLLKRVLDTERLIVLRSLTKIFALPGLRLAYLAAHKRVAARLAALTEPWSLSSPALTAGHFCLAEAAAWAKASSERTAALRAKLVQALESLDLGRLFPSESNYVLLKLRADIKAQELLDYLFQRGILLRDASNFRGLKPGYLRLAVRPEKEIRTLTEALKAFLSAR